MTLEEEKVWLASYHMTGTVQKWYYQLERDEGIPTWPRFADFVNMRFGSPIRNNPLGELAQLWRTYTVEVYQKQFLALLCRTKSLLPTQQVQLFTVGLLNPLRTDVELQNPLNLQTALSPFRRHNKCSCSLHDSHARVHDDIHLCANNFAPSCSIATGDDICLVPKTSTAATRATPTTLAVSVGVAKTPAHNRFRRLLTAG